MIAGVSKKYEKSANHKIPPKILGIKLNIHGRYRWMKIADVLDKYKAGELDMAEAETLIKSSSYDEMGFAKLDTQREQRSGFPEVIFCAGKPDDYLVSIYQKMVANDGCAFGTRASQEQAALVKAAVPEAVYDPVSRILKVEPAGGYKRTGAGGIVAVCSAGTADIPVAEEAAQTAEYFGAEVLRVYDIGVSGIHRLLSKVDIIRSADAVVAVAGMEGALPTVLGGLVRNPVIAVPTSVGYGANFHGLSALITMINSCANGISVVNIDNGYGAGYIATQIGRLAATGR